MSNAANHPAMIGGGVSTMLMNLRNYFDSPDGRSFIGIPIFISIGLVIFSPFWIYQYFHPHRDSEDVQISQTCMYWRVESGEEKRLDGPELRDMCSRYFSSRTPKQTKSDEDWWHSIIQDANEDWKKYSQKQ